MNETREFDPDFIKALNRQLLGIFNNRHRRLAKAGIRIIFDEYKQVGA